jgi:hypothetical protein
MAFVRPLNTSFTRIPDQSLIVSDTHLGGSHISATRDSEKAYALVYSASGLPFTINLGKLSGHLHTAWFNPRTGTSIPEGTVEAMGEKEFLPPSQGETEDWVLILDRR